MGGDEDEDEDEVDPHLLILPAAGSGPAGRGPDAGAARGHSLVGRGVAAPPLLPGQDQDALVDGDRVQASAVGSGAEAAAAALGLPEGGGDAVLHRGRPPSPWRQRPAVDVPVSFR